MCIMSILTLKLHCNLVNIVNMNTNHYLQQDVVTFLKRRKISTLKQLSSALGTPAPRTVFRKLQDVDYLTSYSHAGKYYTLPEMARFTSIGLWSHKSVWFSRFGNLLDTTVSFVDQSEAGYSARELCDILHVQTQPSLMKLCQDGKLQRDKIQGRYIYLSTTAKRARYQLKNRKADQPSRFATLVIDNPHLAVEEAKATVMLFISSLNEKQRRLYAGLESLKLGHGGDCYIATLFGMDLRTVAHGRRELMEGTLDTATTRKPGGGRSSVEKKRHRS